MLASHSLCQEKMADAARDAVIKSDPITDNKLLEAAKLAEGLLASWKSRERERSEASPGS
jgi:hypothetical protein